MSSVPLALRPQVSFPKGASLRAAGGCQQPGDNLGTAFCLRSHAKSGCTKKSYCQHH